MNINISLICILQIKYGCPTLVNLWIFCSFYYVASFEIVSFCWKKNAVVGKYVCVG